MGVLKLVWGYEWLSNNSIQCVLDSSFTQSSVRAGLFTVAIVSMMRYYIVCYKLEKGFKFWLFTWLIILSPIFLLFFYILIGFDGNHNSSWMFCAPFLYQGTLSNVINAIFPLSFLIPCWIITFCYCSIGYTANKQLNQARLQAIARNDKELLIVIKNQKIKLVLQIFVIFMVYNANYMPSYVTLALKYAIGYKRPPILDAIVYILTNSPVAVNPLITITFQPELNQEFSHLLLNFRLKLKLLVKKLFG